MAINLETISKGSFGTRIVTEQLPHQGSSKALLSLPFITICYHAATRTGQPSPICPMSGAAWFVVPCGVRLSEVGFSEFRKPQVGGSIRVASSIFSDSHKTGLGQEAGCARLC